MCPAISFVAFMMDQDAGGAIRAAGRADFFFGSGPEMEDRTGHTESEGRLCYVFLKSPGT